MSCGLLLKENSSWTLWTPRYGIEVNDMMREIGKDHQVGTFEVGLICRGGDDESRESREESIYRAVDWILICVADPLEQCCFTSIRPPNNEDSEVGVPG